MATYYSSFFSSGLMASNHITHDCKESYTPSTPRATPISLDDQDNDTTPVAHPAGPSALPAIITSLASPTSAPERPRLRRRRSSITTSASPVSALKSTPARTATASLQRLTLYTSAPGVRSRSRAGSVTDSFVGRTSMTSNEATQANSLVGRMRSGSVGNALRSVFLS